MEGGGDYREEGGDVEEDRDDRGAVEAGVARGVVRSMARQGLRLPAVGRLPLRAATGGKGFPKAGSSGLPMAAPPRIVMPRRLPVRDVARISDRMSQGLDVWGSAEEVQWRLLSRLHNFATSEYNKLNYF